MKIKEITLLSKEEFEVYKENIKPLEGWWWLRTPSQYGGNPMAVAPGIGVIDAVISPILKFHIRPVLRVDPEASKLMPGTEYQMAGQTWTAISDDILLCNQGIRMIFIEDENCRYCYENSDAKKFLDSWAKERGILIQEKTADREIQNESVDKAPENGEVDWGKNASKKQDKKKKIRR